VEVNLPRPVLFVFFLLSWVLFPFLGWVPFPFLQGDCLWCGKLGQVNFGSSSVSDLALGVTLFTTVAL
jgi:hypothetical protein